MSTSCKLLSFVLNPFFCIKKDPQHQRAFQSILIQDDSVPPERIKASRKERFASRIAPRASR